MSEASMWPVGYQFLNFFPNVVSNCLSLILALALICCVTFDELLNVSVLQFLISERERKHLAFRGN